MKYLLNFKILLVFLIVNISISSDVFCDNKIIHFSGRNWKIKSSTTKIGPGPNLWSDNSEDVWVDSNDQLHLRIVNKGDGSWYCTEVYTEDTFGYGTYIFELASNIYKLSSDPNKHELDPNIVLGFFTWDNNSCLKNANSEIDIEFAKWPTSKYPQGFSDILHYAVQPTKEVKYFPNCKTRHAGFPLELEGEYTTHGFKWLPEGIYFNSYHDHGYPTKYPIIKDGWNYVTKKDNCAKIEGDCMSELIGIPIPSDDMRVHINFWIFDPEEDGKINPPENEQHVVIKSFKYIPYTTIPPPNTPKNVKFITKLPH